MVFKLCSKSLPKLFIKAHGTHIEFIPTEFLDIFKKIIFEGFYFPLSLNPPSQDYDLFVMGKLELSVFLAICSCTTVFTTSTNNTTTQASWTKISTNTAPVTRNSTATPKTAPPTSKPTENCANRNLSCGECVQETDCYWCEADDTCKRYPSLMKVIPRDCEGNTWFWKQCVMAGKFLTATLSSLYPGS